MTKAAARAQSVEDQDHKYDRHPSYSATWAGRREDRVHQWPSEMSEWGEGSRSPSGVGDRKSSTVEMGHLWSRTDLSCILYGDPAGQSERN